VCIYWQVIINSVNLRDISAWPNFIKLDTNCASWILSGLIIQPFRIEKSSPAHLNLYKSAQLSDIAWKSRAISAGINGITKANQLSYLKSRSYVQ
jgi:hypothetical protein